MKRTYDPAKPLRDAFKALLVEKANALMPRIAEDGMATVEKEIAGNSLVFGIWQDGAEPDGVGCMIVKGESVLKIAAGMEATFTLDMKCSAIPCVCAEQAQALRQTHGDGRPS